jgi:putative ABC transport system permease protein
METLRVPLRAGRSFSRADRAGAPRVAIVNEEFARRYWPGEDPLGKRLFEGPTGTESSFEVVGVTSTGRYASVGEEPLPFVYLPQAQHASTAGAVFARSQQGTAAAAAAIRQEVRALEANLPVSMAGPVQQTLAMLLMPQRIAASTLAVFGIIGLLLAVVGIYGLVAFTVAQRTREIGVRMAMGADRRHVVGLFLRHGAKLLLAGSGIGIVLAAVAGRLLTSLLYGTSPTDPLTFTLVPLVLAAAALVAAYLPARRASRLDPSVVLRSD